MSQRFLAFLARLPGSLCAKSVLSSFRTLFANRRRTSSLSVIDDTRFLAKVPPSEQRCPRLLQCRLSAGAPTPLNRFAVGDEDQPDIRAGRERREGIRDRAGADEALRA
jgi:hypothetical protein